MSSAIKFVERKEKAQANIQESKDEKEDLVRNLSELERSLNLLTNYINCLKVKMAQ